MKTREDYDRFLAEVRKLTGIEAMTSDDAGLVSVRVDEKYNVNLQFVEASGKVLCFVEVATLPPDAPKALVYDGKYDDGGSKRQNARLAKARKTGLQNSRGWVEGLPNCWFSICCEFGYSLCGGVFTQDGGRELGRGLLKAASRTCSQASETKLSGK